MYEVIMPLETKQGTPFVINCVPLVTDSVAPLKCSQECPESLYKIVAGFPVMVQDSCEATHYAGRLKDVCCHTERMTIESVSPLAVFDTVYAQDIAGVAPYFVESLIPASNAESAGLAKWGYVSSVRSKDAKGLAKLGTENFASTGQIGAGLIYATSASLSTCASGSTSCNCTAGDVLTTANIMIDGVVVPAGSPVQDVLTLLNSHVHNGSDIKIGQSIVITPPTGVSGAVVTIPATSTLAVALEKIATYLTTPENFGFTVNSGNTASVSDATFGSEIVKNGSVLHFYSQSGTIGFTVAPGSAIVSIDVLGQPTLWESVVVPGAVGGATQTRLIANPQKVIVDDVLGNVGINQKPTQYDLSVGGEMIIYPAATGTPNIRQKSSSGSIISYGELIDGVTDNPTTPYIAIDLGTALPAAMAWTIDYRVRRGAGASKQVGGQVYLYVLWSVVSRLDASSYGADLIEEVVAGIDPLNNHVMLFLNAKSTLFWEFSVFGITSSLENSSEFPVRWEWSSINVLPAYATFVGDIRNSFKKTFTTGASIFNADNGNEWVVRDASKLILANNWCEINTGWKPAVDGSAAITVRIDTRSWNQSNLSGILSFDVSPVISNVVFASSGNRMPTSIIVGMNPNGEVLILIKGSSSVAYAVYVESYANPICHKVPWVINTLAVDPTPTYTTSQVASFNNSFGTITATGTVTSSGIIIASDIAVKENIEAFTPELAKAILSGVNIGTWKYKSGIGKGEMSAGITDANVLRNLLPDALRNDMTPIKNQEIDNKMTDVTYVNQQMIMAVLLTQAKTAMSELEKSQKDLDSANKTIESILARLSAANIK